MGAGARSPCWSCCSRGAVVNSNNDATGFLGTKNAQPLPSRPTSLLTFLYGAGLIGAENRVVALAGANLRRVDLLLADLTGANLQKAHLWGAILRGAKVTHKQLADTLFLQGATMPDGSEHL